MELQQLDNKAMLKLECDTEAVNSTPISNYFFNDIKKYPIEKWIKEFFIERGYKKIKKDYFFHWTIISSTLLDEETLDKNFKGLLHSEFGEGFEDKRKEQYKSYYLRKSDNGQIIHIGIDHRGTRIEVPKNEFTSHDMECLVKYICNYVLENNSGAKKTIETWFEFENYKK